MFHQSMPNLTSTIPDGVMQRLLGFDEDAGEGSEQICRRGEGLRGNARSGHRRARKDTKDSTGTVGLDRLQRRHSAGGDPDRPSPTKGAGRKKPESGYRAEGKDYAELLAKRSSDQFTDNLQASAESLGKGSYPM